MEFLARSLALNDECGARVTEYLHSDRPGGWAVPRAMLYRYWERIVATAIEPLQNIDYLDDGETDICDD